MNVTYYICIILVIFNGIRCRKHISPKKHVFKKPTKTLEQLQAEFAIAYRQWSTIEHRHQQLIFNSPELKPLVKALDKDDSDSDESMSAAQFRERLLDLASKKFLRSEIALEKVLTDGESRARPEEPPADWLVSIEGALHNAPYEPAETLPRFHNSVVRVECKHMDDYWLRDIYFNLRMASSSTAFLIQWFDIRGSGVSRVTLAEIVPVRRLGSRIVLSALRGNTEELFIKPMDYRSVAVVITGCLETEVIRLMRNCVHLDTTIPTLEWTERNAFADRWIKLFCGRENEETLSLLIGRDTAGGPEEPPKVQVEAINPQVGLLVNKTKHRGVHPAVWDKEMAKHRVKRQSVTKEDESRKSSYPLFRVDIDVKSFKDELNCGCAGRLFHGAPGWWPADNETLRTATCYDNRYYPQVKIQANIFSLKPDVKMPSLYLRNRRQHYNWTEIRAKHTFGMVNGIALICAEQFFAVSCVNGQVASCKAPVDNDIDLKDKVFGKAMGALVDHSNEMVKEAFEEAFSEVDTVQSEYVDRTGDAMWIVKDATYPKGYRQIEEPDLSCAADPLFSESHGEAEGAETEFVVESAAPENDVSCVLTCPGGAWHNDIEHITCESPQTMVKLVNRSSKRMEELMDVVQPHELHELVPSECDRHLHEHGFRKCVNGQWDARCETVCSLPDDRMNTLTLSQPNRNYETIAKMTKQKFTDKLKSQISEGIAQGASKVQEKLMNAFNIRGKSEKVEDNPGYEVLTGLDSRTCDKGEQRKTWLAGSKIKIDCGVGGARQIIINNKKAIEEDFWICGEDGFWYTDPPVEED